MIPSFSNLSANDLRTLAGALKSGRLVAPFSKSLLARTNISPYRVEETLGAFTQLVEHGFTEQQICVLLQSIELERKSHKKLDELISLVITGPEAPGTTIRDTGVVVRELFRKASQSVVVVGYSVYQGQQVFAALAERMMELPELESKMYLNLPPVKDTDEESIVTRRFARDFEKKHWPAGCRLPAIYFDPRSIEEDRSKRASLHAKCVIVDGVEIFITSANFTERAQNMNVEVGVRFASKTIAKQLQRHFSSLVSIGALKPLRHG